jgi:hypothetical protein
MKSEVRRNPQTTRRISVSEEVVVVFAVRVGHATAKPKRRQS